MDYGQCDILLSHCLDGGLLQSTPLSYYVAPDSHINHHQLVIRPGIRKNKKRNTDKKQFMTKVCDRGQLLCDCQYVSPDCEIKQINELGLTG